MFVCQCVYILSLLSSWLGQHVWPARLRPPCPYILAQNWSYLYLPCRPADQQISWAISTNLSHKTKIGNRQVMLQVMLLAFKSWNIFSSTIQFDDVARLNQLVMPLQYQRVLCADSLWRERPFSAETVDCQAHFSRQREGFQDFGAVWLNWWNVNHWRTKSTSSWLCISFEIDEHVFLMTCSNTFPKFPVAQLEMQGLHLTHNFLSARMFWEVFQWQIFCWTNLPTPEFFSDFLWAHFTRPQVSIDKTYDHEAMPCHQSAKESESVEDNLSQVLETKSFIY